MRRKLVKSSSILAIGYNEKSFTMQVEFLNKDIYEYYNVPKFVYEAFISAKSIGSYFMEHIRSEYRYSEV